MINNIGASAAYMIAMHADRVVAGKYSLVGSIGAIMTPWRLDRAISKFDVAQRAYASGPLKEFLNPWTPISPAVDEKAKLMVNQIGQTFVADLHATRGDKLKPNFNYGTGEPWSALEAKELGLIDEIGTLDGVITSSWNLDSHNFGPYQQQGAFSLGALHNEAADLVNGYIARQSFQVH